MKVCIYHSREWEVLVSTGWITHVVDEMPDGRLIATMYYIGGHS